MGFALRAARCACLRPSGCALRLPSPARFACPAARYAYLRQRASLARLRATLARLLAGVLRLPAALNWEAARFAC